MHISYSKKFAEAWSALEKRLLPSYVWTSDPLTFWRERILFLICFIAAVFGPIALVPSLLLSYSEGLWIVILVDFLAYMAAVTILIVRNVSFVVRALFICFILYALGVCILFILGPGGAGYIWLFGVSVLISTFFGLGAAIWTLGFNTIVMLSVGIFIAYGNPVWILHVDNALVKWLVMSTNFLLLNAFVTITTAFMLNGLKTAIIMEQKISKRLRDNEEKYRTVADFTFDWEYWLAPDGKYIYISPACERISGYRAEEFLQDPNLLEKITHPDDKHRLAVHIHDVLQGKSDACELEFRIITRDGKERWISHLCQDVHSHTGEYLGRRGSNRDITAGKRMEEKILALSITDQLTGLYNRRGFLSLAGQQLKLSERNKSEMLLFFADLDLLKWINDTLGHEEGDKALVEAANIFRETFRTSDIIARLGGDEYAVLAVNLTEANSKTVTARLQQLIDIRINQENRRYNLSISMGCAYYDPENPCSIDELIARADKLMYEQKQNKQRLLA